MAEPRERTAVASCWCCEERTAGKTDITTSDFGEEFEELKLDIQLFSFLVFGWLVVWLSSSFYMAKSMAESLIARSPR